LEADRTNSQLNLRATIALADRLQRMNEVVSAHREPTLKELLSDEITQAVMAADRVGIDALLAMVAEVASSRRDCIPLQPEPVDDCEAAVD
jgi:hypothetical protein